MNIANLISNHSSTYEICHISLHITGNVCLFLSYCSILMLTHCTWKRLMSGRRVRICFLLIFGLSSLSSRGRVDREFAFHQCGLGSIPNMTQFWVSWFSTLLLKVFLPVFQFSSLAIKQRLICSLSNRSFQFEHFFPNNRPTRCYSGRKCLWNIASCINFEKIKTQSSCKRSEI